MSPDQIENDIITSYGESERVQLGPMAPKEGILNYIFEVETVDPEQDSNVAMGFMKGNETISEKDSVFLDTHNFQWFKRTYAYHNG